MPYVITIESGTPESAEIVRRVQRANRLTEDLNRLRYHEMEAIQHAWAELTGQPADATFHLIPPVRTEHGLNIRVGRNVFINHGCTLMDIGGIDIGDDVMIGPNASLITSGHPLDPTLRRKQIVAAPIVVERNVWIGASAMIMHGVTVGADSVVAAGAVVTSDVPPATVVGGVPARVLRSVYDEPLEPAG